MAPTSKSCHPDISSAEPLATVVRAAVVLSSLVVMPMLNTAETQRASPKNRRVIFCWGGGAGVRRQVIMPAWQARTKLRHGWLTMLRSTDETHYISFLGLK